MPRDALQVSSANGQVRVLGTLGVELALQSEETEGVETQQLSFLVNLGALMRISKVLLFVLLHVICPCLLGDVSTSFFQLFLLTESCVIAIKKA